jgi:hypothetical protein
MGETIEGIRREALEILRVDYPKVKEGMLRLEVFMQAKSRKAVYELRDFLDHLALLFQNDISIDEANKHIYECRTHLRRCVIEPLEYMAEKRFVKLDRYARWCARVPFIFRNNPFSKPEFFQRMKEAKEQITKGRIVKTEGQACEHMDKAFEIVTDLLAQVAPLKYLMQGIVWLAGIFIAGLLTGAIAIWLKK